MSMALYPELANQRLDRVSLYDGQLSFLVPHEWEEIEEEEQYCYEEPPQLGWLRVSIIIKNGKHCGNPARVEDSELEYATKNGRKFAKCGTNFITSWQEFSEREVVPICNSYWSVCHCISEDLVKTALFTYTVESSRLNQDKTHQMIGLLGELFAGAQFS